MPHEFSSDAQDTMRGGFVFAGEAAAPSLPGDLGVESVVGTPGGHSYHSLNKLRDATAEYFDPNVNLSVDQQLHYGSMVMEAIGLQPPFDLSGVWDNRLEQTQSFLAATPEGVFPHDPQAHWRLVVAPLFPNDDKLLQNRQQMFRTLQTNGLDNGLLSTAQEPLWAPEAFTDYGQLLRNPANPAYTDSGDEIKTGLRYLDSHGVDLGRHTYITTLHDYGWAIPGANNTLWTYNFVDVRPTTPRSSQDAQTLFKSLGSQSGATSTPEQELVVQALHIIAGTSNTEGHKTITNEAVYELTRKGNPKDLRGVSAIVCWDHPAGKQVDLGSRLPESSSHYLGVRGSVSGIGRRYT